MLKVLKVALAEMLYFMIAYNVGLWMGVLTVFLYQDPSINIEISGVIAYMSSIAIRIGYMELSK